MTHSTPDPVGEGEVYSDKCSCGKDHETAGMAAFVLGKLPDRDPDCRLLTWKEVAAKNLDTALKHRKEAKDALAERAASHQRIERLTETLEQIADAERAEKAQTWDDIHDWAVWAHDLARSALAQHPDEAKA